MGILAGTILLAYLFQSFCFMLICRKAGKPGGVLVWLPLFQAIPLLRAAGMSGWWFLGLMLPVLNIVGSIMWAFKIVEARGKHWILGFLLLLPVTNILTILFLAFSGGGESEPTKKIDARIQIMTLETA